MTRDNDGVFWVAFLVATEAGNVLAKVPLAQLQTFVDACDVRQRLHGL